MARNATVRVHVVADTEGIEAQLAVLRTLCSQVADAVDDALSSLREIRERLADERREGAA